MSWIYKRGGIWWIGYRANGRQVLRSANTRDKSEAQKQLATVALMFNAQKAGNLDELYRLLSGKTIPKVTLESALQDWLAECAGSTSSGTLGKYQVTADDFKAHVQPGLLLASVTPDDVRGFLIHRRKSTAATTVNQIRKILSVFFGREIKNGRLQTNPCGPVRALKAPKDEESARRAFTLAEVQLILSKAGDEFWHYMITAGFYTGQRLGDLITLPWGAVDMVANVIRLTSRKTQTRVVIPMAPPLRALLEARMREAGDVVKPASPVWPQQARYYEEHGAAHFSNAFYDILASCGLVAARNASHAAAGQGRASKRKASNLSFHCLRHAFVSALKATGAAQSTAKFLTGHTTDSINDHYSHADEKVLADAINALPSIA